MARLGSWVSVKRGDHERVLITETLPYETPLIFSGDGFYSRMKEHPSANAIQRALTKILVLRERPKPNPVTIPFSYKIRKGTTEFRKLGVVHPSSLWDVNNFYARHDEWLIYQCSRSPFSIRAPDGISGSFYERNEADAMNQYKKGQVLSSESAIHSRYNPSYFAYKGYNRLYKFFQSDRFVRLEQQYAILKTIDTSRCFDSIYTHSITWATMSKVVAKDSKSLRTRADQFDRLMQNLNHGETSGIIIGPEISRIFAEIIFQRIDVTVMQRLKTMHLTSGHDYEVYRYVDDVFVFSNSKAVSQTIYECYTDAMAQFNLYSNPHKSVELERPFTTHKTQVIEKSKRFIEDLERELFMQDVSPRSILRPKTKLSPERISAKLIAAVRTICFDSSSHYEDLSSYILSACCERIKRLVKRKRVGAEEVEDYRNSIAVIIKLMFFLYTVAPIVSASFRFASGMILLVRFTKSKLALHSREIEEMIFSEVCAFLQSEANRRSRNLSSFVSLEALNVLIFAKELSVEFLLPQEVLLGLFLDGRKVVGASPEWCYFDLVACLYYIGSNPRYAVLRLAVDEEIDRRLKTLVNVERVAEQAYLLLDALSCPYITVAKKQEWLVAFQQLFSIPTFTQDEIDTFIQESSEKHWFTGWGGVDLLTLLQKKELVPTY